MLTKVVAPVLENQPCPDMSHRIDYWANYNRGAGKAFGDGSRLGTSLSYGYGDSSSFGTSNGVGFGEGKSTGAGSTGPRTSRAEGFALL